MIVEGLPLPSLPSVIVNPSTSLRVGTITEGKLDKERSSTIIDLSGDVRTIQKHTTANSSRSSYNSTLCNFILFLYQNEQFRSILTATAITALDKAREMDINTNKVEVGNNKEKGGKSSS